MLMWNLTPAVQRGWIPPDVKDHAALTGSHLCRTGGAEVYMRKGWCCCDPDHWFPEPLPYNYSREVCRVETCIHVPQCRPFHDT